MMEYTELFRRNPAPPATSLPPLPTSIWMPSPLVPPEQRQLLVLGRTDKAPASLPAARAPLRMVKHGRAVKRSSSPLSRSRCLAATTEIFLHAAVPVATAAAYCVAAPQPRKRPSIELQDGPFDSSDHRPAKRSRKSLIIQESLQRLSKSPGVLDKLFDVIFLPALLARLDVATAATAAKNAAKNAAAAAAKNAAGAVSPRPATATALQGQTTPSLLAVAVRAGSATTLRFLREVFDAHREALGRHDHVGDKAARSRMSQEAVGRIKNLTLWLPQFCLVMSSIYEAAQMTASPQQMAVHAADGALVINAVIDTAAEAVSKGRIQSVVEAMTTDDAQISQNLGIRAVRNVSAAVGRRRRGSSGAAPAPLAEAIAQLGVLQGLCGLDENGAAQTGGELAMATHRLGTPTAGPESGHPHPHGHPHPAWSGFVAAMSNVARALDRPARPDCGAAAAVCPDGRQPGAAVEALLRSAEVQAAWLAVAALLGTDRTRTMRLFAWTGREFAMLRSRYRQQTVIIMKSIAGVPSSLR